ncbi:hypothetical protein [Metabacillus bambusae]|uniref:IDEAL domain-containing protein n=1 Tax=Metabacillus bambusae TaxID=2795218 RepID=A0ABS3N9U1_9BACI|nr:hypothetical protein [Metabacillus bambusae]MBO1515056.1 hypothetical protein [Metabacillus bambusae]
MTDIPKLLEAKAKERNEKIFKQIMVLLATNNRSLNEEKYEEFMKNITKQLDINPVDQFDREKFEHLRFLTNSGANKL